MTIAEMFGQSGVLALLGMGIVFSFLIILVLFMTLVAKIVKFMKWDVDAQASSDGSAASAAAGAANQAAVVAAIGAAVNEYRKTHP